MKIGVPRIGILNGAKVISSGRRNILLSEVLDGTTEGLGYRADWAGTYPLSREAGD